MRILVVDDQPILCDALRKYLEQIAPEVIDTPVNVTCAGTLTDAVAAVCIDVGRPDLVFLDLNLDHENKSEATLERFQEGNIHRVPVVVFTGLDLREEGTVEILRRCLNEFGAETVLMKGADLSTMFIGLRRILGREDWLPKELIHAFISSPAPNPEKPLGLSPRQWDVARGLQRGLRNKEIAKELKIAPGNVQQITGAIYKRLGVHSRWEVMKRLNDRSGSRSAGAGDAPPADVQRRRMIA